MATDDDGFQVVKRRGRYTAAPKAPRNGTASVEPHLTTSLRAEDILARVDSYKNSLQRTQFYHEVNDLLVKVKMSFSVVVCYGIGHVGSCSIAQQQLALLLLILEELKPSQSWVYDPVLIEQERTAIEKCGCALFTTNDVCKYTAKHCSLFYMPHCGIAMYNNLLWANWDPCTLSKIAIIGNRFSSYNERLPQRQFKTSLYVYRIFNSCLEYPLPNCYFDTTVFNDLAVHSFPSAHLNSLPKDTWTDIPEPTLDPLDPEIITS